MALINCAFVWGFFLHMQEKVSHDVAHIFFSYLFALIQWGPQGFWGSWEKGYLFSGSWGALLIIFGELGSKHILWVFREHCQKVKQKQYQASILSDSLKCRWLLGGVAPRTPYIIVIYFQFLYTGFQNIKYYCMGAFF